MGTSFERVPFGTDEPQRGALIHVFRRRGRVVATVTQYEWSEPDGHEHTGYADVVTSLPAPAGEVLPAYGKSLAQVALESDDIWDPAWGMLR